MERKHLDRKSNDGVCPRLNRVIPSGGESLKQDALYKQSWRLALPPLPGVNQSFCRFQRLQLLHRCNPTHPRSAAQVATSLKTSLTRNSQRAVHQFVNPAL